MNQKILNLGLLGKEINYRNQGLLDIRKNLSKKYPELNNSLLIYCSNDHQFQHILQNDDNFNSYLTTFFNEKEIDQFFNSKIKTQKISRFLGYYFAKLLFIEISGLKKLNCSIFKKVIIGKDHFGRPFFLLNDIKVEKLIFFSISHKCNSTIVAMGVNQVGIDLEIKRSFSENLKNKVFNSDEIQNSSLIIDAVEKTKSLSDLNSIYSIMFSMKEATAKAIGKGLYINFKKLKISPFKNYNVILYNDENNKKLHFLTLVRLKENKIFTLSERLTSIYS